MAKVNMVLDTDTNELSVDVDGEKIENVMGVSCYCYDDEKYSVSISTMEEMDNGMRKSMYMTASEDCCEGKPHPKSDKILINEIKKADLSLASVLESLVHPTK